MNTYEIMNYIQNNNKCLAHVYTKYQNKYSENKPEVRTGKFVDQA